MASTLTPAEAPAPATPTLRSHAPERLELVERGPGSESHARQRRLGKRHRDAGLVAQPPIHPAKQDAASGEGDPTVADIRRQLGWSRLERVLHRRDDPLHGAVERTPQLLRAELEPPQHPRLRVATADGAIELLLERPR